jgi:predicted small lipoprotein YifL
MKLQNSLILLVFLASLTACADRERLNCPPTKNKALRSAGEVIVPTTPPPAYGTGGKC